MIPHAVMHALHVVDLLDELTKGRKAGGSTWLSQWFSNKLGRYITPQEAEYLYWRLLAEIFERRAAEHRKFLASLAAIWAQSRATMAAAVVWATPRPSPARVVRQAIAKAAPAPEATSAQELSPTEKISRAVGVYVYGDELYPRALSEVIRTRGEPWREVGGENPWLVVERVDPELAAHLRRLTESGWREAAREYERVKSLGYALRALAGDDERRKLFKWIQRGPGAALMAAEHYWRPRCHIASFDPTIATELEPGADVRPEDKATTEPTSGSTFTPGV
jgi:hypothetical protein